MRAWPIEITQPEFDRFLYGYATNVAAKDVPEHLISIRLVEKLQDEDVTEKKEPTKAELEEAEEAGEFAWPTHRLAVDVHTFLFEEDEKDLALTRLEKNIGRVPPALGAEFEVLRQKFLEAESIDLSPPVEELEAKVEEIDRALSEAEAELPT